MLYLTNDELIAITQMVTNSTVQGTEQMKKCIGLEAKLIAEIELRKQQALAPQEEMQETGKE